MAAVVVAALGGCGRETIPVQGTVQREGAALTGGRIVFVPVGGGKPAAGDIQSDGTFRTTIEPASNSNTSRAYRIRVVETRDSETGLMFTSHEPPPDKTQQIVPGETNDITVNIRAQDGWQTQADK